MLKDFLISFTSQYHDLGHSGLLSFDTIKNSEAVNSFIDTAQGFGHRLKANHNFDGFLDSLELDGVQGATTWFDHMLKDFTSHDGIPMPGAMFIKEATGMDFEQSVDWLCINAADVIELGAAMGGMELLEKKFTDNPFLKTTALAIAGCIGIIDDNPLLVGYVTIQAASTLNQKYKILREENLSHVKVGSRIFFRGIQIVSIGTFFTGVAAQSFFNLNIIELASELTTSAIDTITIFGDGSESIVVTAGQIGDITDAGSLAADAIDGLSTLGLGLAVSLGVRSLFKFLNGSKYDNIRNITRKIILRNQLKTALTKQLSPVIIKGYLTQGEQRNWYPTLLLNP